MCQNFKFSLSFAKFGRISKLFENIRNFWQNSVKIKFWRFFRKNVLLEQCKGVHCVDLGESFQTHIYLQNFVSIQPRTNPLKLALPDPRALPAARAVRRARPLAPEPRGARRASAREEGLAGEVGETRSMHTCLPCRRPGNLQDFGKVQHNCI